MVEKAYALGLILTAVSLWLGGCRRMHREPFERQPLAGRQPEAAPISETQRLTVERVRFWSGELQEARFFLALVPKPPLTASSVLIVNHGWADRPEHLPRELKIDQVYDAMLGRSEARPAVVVMPDVRFGSHFRIHAARYPYPNYLTLVAEETARIASARYGVPFERERWGIGGFSFGGFLSLDVGRRYAGRFASVSVISGFGDGDWSYWPARPPDPGRLDDKGRGKHTIVVPGPAPRLFLACGTNDRLFATMRLLHDRLLGLGIRHEWSTSPGGHTWKYWSSVVEPMLKFHLGSTRPQEAPR